MGLTSTPRCLLHIGAPKTGSTALQQFLTANRGALLRQGWCYPDVSLRGFGHHDLAFLSAGGYPSWATPQGRGLDDLVRDLRGAVSNAERIILSSEDFYLQGKPAETAGVLERAGLPPEAVRVVVYVRRQDRVHMSYYNQMVKAQGYTRSIEDAIGECRRLWDYDANLGDWAGVFGIERLAVRVYPDDPRSSWDVRRDFLDVAGIPGAGWVWPSEPINTRINRDLLEWQRRLNRLPLSPQNKRRFHKPLMAISALPESRELFEDAPLLDPRRRRDLLAYYEPGNRRVARRYLGRDTLFDDAISADPPQGRSARQPAWKKFAFVLRWAWRQRTGR